MSYSNGAAGWLASEADIISNIASNLVSAEKLIIGAAYLMGIMFAFKAIFTLKIYGEARTMMSSHSNIKEPLAYLLVAGIFVYFPTALSLFLNTTFGSTSILQYAPVNSENQTISTLFGSGSTVGRPLSLVIQIIGLIAFVRGWVLIARGASQGQPPGGTGKGLVHVFGGILAMNIVATLEIINNTLYGAS